MALRAVLTPRLIVTAVAVLAFTASTGCSSIFAKQKRTQRVEQLLGEVRYQKPLDEVWQEVRKLLADREYPLAAKDAAAVGQGEMNLAARLFSPAKETRLLSEDVGLLQQLRVVGSGGKVNGYFLETGWAPHGAPRSRVRAEAAEDGQGVAVRFERIVEDVTDHRETSSRSAELELELARRLDPAAAARVEAGAK